MLIGRRLELDVLAAALEQERPVVLYGESGIGKTALLRGAVAASGREAFEGGGLSTLSWMPYLPLARALGVPSLPGGDPAFVADEVERAVGDGVLVVDDLQWCDGATRALVPLLTGRVALLAAVRRGDPGVEAALKVAAEAGAEVLDVEPLDSDAAAELVRRSRPDLQEPLVQRVVERSGCNPLLLQELSADGEPSGSLRLALAARLRPVSAEGRHVLGLLALAGRPLAPRLLGPPAGELVEAGIAVVTDDAVAVRHALLAESAVADLDDADRRRLSAELARLLPDPGEAARHHAAAGERQEAHGKALQAAAMAGTPGERAAHLRLAAASATGPDADLLRLEAAEAVLDARHGGDIAELLDAMTTTDPELRGRAAVLRSWERFLAGDPAGMRAAVAEGLGFVAGSGSPSEVRLRVAEARIGVSVDDFTPAALDLARSACRMAHDTGVDVAWAESVLAGARYLGGHHDWAQHLEVAIGAGRRDGDLDAELTAAQNLVTFHEADGSQDEATRVASAMVERARELRLTGWERQFRQQLQNLDFHAGRYAEVIDAGYAFAGEAIDLRSRERSEQALLVALVDVGRFDEAAARLEWGLETASPDKQGRWWFEWGQAELELWSGRAAEAVTTAERALAWPGLEPALASFPHLSRAWACTVLAEPLPGPLPPLSLAMLAGASKEDEALLRLGAGDAEGAAQAFEEAAEAWRPYHRRGELRARYGVGEARRRAGDVSGARQALLEAESRAHELGFVPLLAWIRRSLRLAGVARAAPRAKSDEHGLTARERQILVLVSDGLGNAEIARRLGVSRSTVAAQLGSASAKLGASGRAQAAALARS